MYIWYQFFLPVVSLCGVVDSPSWFLKCLIGKKGNMWWVVYINEKCMYYSKTRPCITIECAIVLNVCHVTPTWALISWWHGAVNLSRTPSTERTLWNYLEVNFVPASVWIWSKSHQPILSTFLNLDWKIYSLSMIS